MGFGTIHYGLGLLLELWDTLIGHRTESKADTELFLVKDCVVVLEEVEAQDVVWEARKCDQGDVANFVPGIVQDVVFFGDNVGKIIDHEVEVWEGVDSGAFFTLGDLAVVTVVGWVGVIYHVDKLIAVFFREQNECRTTVYQDIVGLEGVTTDDVCFISRGYIFGDVGWGEHTHTLEGNEPHLGCFLVGQIHVVQVLLRGVSVFAQIKPTETDLRIGVIPIDENTEDFLVNGSALFHLRDQLVICHGSRAHTEETTDWQCAFWFYG